MKRDNTLIVPPQMTKRTSGVTIAPPPAHSTEENSFLPILHGKATDALASMTSKPVKKNVLNNTGVITSGETKLVVQNFDKLIGTLGVSTHKLLSTAIAVFTDINNTGTKKREAKYSGVSIPLKDYAFKCGNDVYEHTTETPEEAKKEALRAKRALDNSRRKINKDLTLLYNSSLSWSEKVKGKQGDYMDVRLIEAKGIKNGNITIVFSQSFAEYLVQLPLSQYPIALLRLDERNSNAYIMGVKMAEHSNMYNNIKRETSQLLKVKTLMALTDLPSIDKVRQERRRWEDRIKEPFENSLDALTACGLLEDWYYSHSKGVPLTDEEATSFSCYEEWSETLVHFNLKDAPDHTERLEAREAEKKAKQTAKSKKTSKKK